MEEFGDPTFEYHQTMVKIWGLLAMRLSSDILLPLYPIDYALTMKYYLDQLTCDKPSNSETEILKKGHHNKNNNKTLEHDLPKLASALHNLHKSTIQFNTKIQGLDRLVSEDKKQDKRTAKQISVANERLIKLERTFVKNHGLLVDRPWYRHALFAPSAKTGLIQAFPSIVESRELKDLKTVAEMEETLADILKDAQNVLSNGKSKGKSKHHNFASSLDEDVTFDFLK